MATIAALLVAVTGAGYVVLLRSAFPEDPGGTRSGTLLVGQLARTYRYYIPPAPVDEPALVLAFHPSGGTGTQMRAQTGYALERLADEHGFIVVYPDGYERHWNDCRRHAPYAASRENIDDPGFVCALLEQFRREHGAGAHVLALGYSNGGQLVFRLALEAPELVTAGVAFAANLPIDEHLDCVASGGGVPMLIVNGTEDPISHYQGGKVTIFGFGNRGMARSAAATAHYFAELAGATPEAEIDRLPERDGNTATWVERAAWSGPAGEVVLLTVHGGGHTIPQRGVRLPRLLGPTSGEIEGPLEAWRFLQRQLARPAIPSSSAAREE